MQPEIAERDPFLKRVRARLADRNRWPRHWWYPLPYREYEEVSHKTLDTDHKSCSDTIRRSMLTLLGLSLFCLATAFGATDVDLLKGDPTIEIPFADVKMSFVGFLVVAPLLLIVVSVYLHLFVGHKLLLEDIQENHSPINQTPTLFNLGHPIARWLTAFIFYWLVPLVLAVITQVARTRLEWGLALGGVTVVTTAVFLVLQIRRCTLWRRVWWNPPRWASLVGVVGLAVWLVVNPERFHRPSNLDRADLHGVWLVRVQLPSASLAFTNLKKADLIGANLTGADVSGANLTGADVSGANLSGADLTGADLTGANLTGADLTGANLTGADLTGAHLTGADLTGANLTGADVSGANLTGADLTGANLSGADLRGAYGLTCPQLKSARFWAGTFRDLDLACGKRPRAPLPEQKL